MGRKVKTITKDLKAKSKNKLLKRSKKIKKEKKERRAPYKPIENYSSFWLE